MEASHSSPRVNNRASERTTGSFIDVKIKLTKRISIETKYAQS